MKAATTAAPPGGQPDAPDPLATPGLGVEALELGPLAVAGIGDHQDVDVVAGHVAGDDLVALPEPDAPHPGRVPAHRPHVALGEPDRHALAGHHEHVVAALRLDHPHQAVAGRRLIAMNPSRRTCRTR